MPAKDVIEMFLALTKFVAGVHGNDVAMVNQILEGCYDALAARGLVTDREGEALLLDMLHQPLEVCAAGVRQSERSGMRACACDSGLCT